MRWFIGFQRNPVEGRLFLDFETSEDAEKFLEWFRKIGSDQLEKYVRDEEEILQNGADL